MFVWTVENLGKEEIEVSIMFTFQNGTGGPSDEAGGHHNESFLCKGVFSEVRLQNQSGAKNRSPEKAAHESKQHANEAASPQEASRTLNANEICVVHDVSGVLLHHSHARRDFTFAVAAKHVTEVSMCCQLFICM